MVDDDDKDTSKEKEIDKLMALISLSFKKIYKPTNNNLRTSSNTSRVNQDNSPRIHKNIGYEGQRSGTVAGARDTVGIAPEVLYGYCKYSPCLYNFVLLADLPPVFDLYILKLNLTKLDMYRSDLKRNEAYIAHSNLRGFVYLNKDKKNMLMRINELHKFSDGTLTDVRTALDDPLKGIRMQYLPQSIWSKSDKDRASAMIQAIDKRLKPRRIMKSLERFVGGRLYEGDFRMLQRTI
nr:hypothetical protein [Tanacetum cinerariifolium]